MLSLPHESEFSSSRVLLFQVFTPRYLMSPYVSLAFTFHILHSSLKVRLDCMQLPGELLMLNGSSKPVVTVCLFFFFPKSHLSLKSLSCSDKALISLLHSLPAHSLKIYQCKMFFACTFIFYLFFYNHG